MNDEASGRRMYLNRLRQWEEEKRANKHGMQRLADRAIAVLRAEIESLWPGALDEPAAGEGGANG